MMTGRVLLIAALTLLTRLLSRGAPAAPTPPTPEPPPLSESVLIVCREAGPPLTELAANVTLPSFEEPQTAPPPDDDPLAAIVPLGPLQLVSFSDAETEQLCSIPAPPLLHLLAVALFSGCAGALLAARSRSTVPPPPVKTAERKEDDARCCAASTTSEVPRIGPPEAVEAKGEGEVAESGPPPQAPTTHGWRRVGDGRLASVVSQ